MEVQIPPPQSPRRLDHQLQPRPHSLPMLPDLRHRPDHPVLAHPAHPVRPSSRIGTGGMDRMSNIEDMDLGLGMGSIPRWDMEADMQGSDHPAQMYPQVLHPTQGHRFPQGTHHQSRQGSILGDERDMPMVIGTSMNDDSGGFAIHTRNTHAYPPAFANNLSLDMSPLVVDDGIFNRSGVNSEVGAFRDGGLS